GPLGFFAGFDAPAVSGTSAAFVGEYGDAADPNSFVHGVFTGSGGALTTIAKPGDYSSVGTIPTVLATSISNNVVAFLGSYDTPNHSPRAAGVFKGSGGPLTTIITTGAATPAGDIDLLGNTVAISGDNIAIRAQISDIKDAALMASGTIVTSVAASMDAASSSVLGHPFGELS